MILTYIKAASTASRRSEGDANDMVVDNENNSAGTR